MGWTKEKPAKPGRYWYRYEGPESLSKRHYIAEVFKHPVQDEELVVISQGGTRVERLKDSVVEWWPDVIWEPDDAPDGKKVN